MKSTSHPQWPRLSETLPHERHPQICQSCGIRDPENLTRCIEHDDRDQPEDIIVVLCRSCYGRLIDKHPRLYDYLVKNQPHPGSMPVCVGCRHRDGLRCANPKAKRNGGAGVELHFSKPTVAHVLLSGKGGGRTGRWMNIYTSPVSCTDREATDENE